MTDQIGDLHNLIKIIANPDLAAKILEETKAHIDAKRENDRTAVEIGNARRQLITERESLDNLRKQLENNGAECQKANAVLDGKISEHRTHIAQFQRDRGEFDQRLANLVQREGSLNERGTAIGKMREEAEAMKAKYEAMVKSLRDIVNS